jgi:hypothetical protein
MALHPHPEYGQSGGEKPAGRLGLTAGSAGAEILKWAAMAPGYHHRAGGAVPAGRSKGGVGWAHGWHRAAAR